MGSMVCSSLVLLLCLAVLRSVVVGVLKVGAPMKHFVWIALYLQHFNDLMETKIV